jgi:hypothetical protein
MSVLLTLLIAALVAYLAITRADVQPDHTSIDATPSDR